MFAALSISFMMIFWYFFKILFKKSFVLLEHKMISGTFYPFKVYWLAYLFQIVQYLMTTNIMLMCYFLKKNNKKRKKYFLFGQHLALYQIRKSTKQTPAGWEELLPTRCGCSWAPRTPLRGWKPWARRAAWSAGGKWWIWPARTRRGFLSTPGRSCAWRWAPRRRLQNQPVRSHKSTAHNEKIISAGRKPLDVMDRRAGSDFQVFTLQMTDLLHENKKVTLRGTCR